MNIAETKTMTMTIGANGIMRQRNLASNISGSALQSHRDDGDDDDDKWNGSKAKPNRNESDESKTDNNINKQQNFQRFNESADIFVITTSTSIRQAQPNIKHDEMSNKNKNDKKNDKKNKKSNKNKNRKNKCFIFPC